MKKILLISAVILFLASCKKDMSTETPQADLTLKKYADIAAHAALSYNSDGEAVKIAPSTIDKIENDKGKDDKGNLDKGDNDKGDKGDKGDKDKDDKDKGKTEALKSVGAGTISYTPNGCGSGTLQLKSVGAGFSTVLGVFKQTTTVCINGATGEIIGLVVGTAKTSNGDVYYTFVGAGMDAATGFMFQNYVISGGTGKFKNATGTLRLLYHVNTPTTFAYTGTGSITY